MLTDKQAELIELLLKRCDQEVGVTPQELYMRQLGLCWLVMAKDSCVLCTDGAETSPLANLLNPTMECVGCISRFISELVVEKPCDTPDTAKQEPPT